MVYPISVTNPDCSIDLRPLKTIFNAALNYVKEILKPSSQAVNLKALHQPFGQAIGINGSELTDGSAILNMTPQEQHLNTYGSVHGGLTSAVLDQVMSEAARTTAKLEEATVTSELAVKYLKPIQPNISMQVQAQVSKLPDDKGKLNVVSCIKQNGEIKSIGVGKFVHLPLAS